MTATDIKWAHPVPPEAAQPSGDRPDSRERGLAPWGVVAIWAGLLGILVATDAGFGNNTLVLEVSGSSAGFVALLAGIVWLDRRLRPRRGLLRRPVRIGGAVMIVITAMVAWMGFAFGAWLLMVAVVPLTVAIGLEISARRHAREERRGALAVLAARPDAGVRRDLSRDSAYPDGAESAAGVRGSREPELAGRR